MFEPLIVTIDFQHFEISEKSVNSVLLTKRKKPIFLIIILFVQTGRAKLKICRSYVITDKLKYINYVNTIILL